MKGRAFGIGVVNSSIGGGRQPLFLAVRSLWRRAGLWRLSMYVSVLFASTFVIVMWPALHSSKSDSQPIGHYTPPTQSDVQPPASGLGSHSVRPLAEAKGDHKSPSTQIPVTTESNSPAGSSTPVTFQPNSFMGTIQGNGLTATYCCAGAMSTIRVSKSYASGKYYFELILKTGGRAAHPGTWTNAGIVQVGGTVRPGASVANTQVQVIGWGRQKEFKDGDLIGFAVDFDNGQFYFHVNGDWKSGLPSQGPGIQLAVGREYVPFVSVAAPSAQAERQSDAWTANFGRTPFKTTLPDGYLPYDHGDSQGGRAPQPVVQRQSVSPEQGKGQVITAAMPNTALTASTQTSAGEGIGLMGRTFSSVVPFLGRQLPLPGGVWKVVAYVHGGTGEGRSRAIFLARVTEGKLLAASAFIGSEPTAEPPIGYRQYSQCMRKQLVHAEVHVNDDFGLQECWTINHNDSNAWRNTQDALLRAAMGELAISHLEVPQTMVSVHFRLADKSGYLNGVYFFNPEEEGIMTTPASVWQESEWYSGNINKYPEKSAYVQRLRLWGAMWLPKLKVTFLNVPERS